MHTQPVTYWSTHNPAATVLFEDIDSLPCVHGISSWLISNMTSTALRRLITHICIPLWQKQRFSHTGPFQYHIFRCKILRLPLTNVYPNCFEEKRQYQRLSFTLGWFPLCCTLVKGQATCMADIACSITWITLTTHSRICIWRSVTSRLNLRVPEFQISCNNFT